MKKQICLLLLLSGLIVGTGCKKFLHTDPKSDLSGNNFWQTRGDVEAFTLNLYDQFRQATFRVNPAAPPGDGSDFPFFSMSGDMRCAPAVAPTGRPYIPLLVLNDIRSVLNSSRNSYYDFFNYARITKWDVFYKDVASANILYSQVDGVPDPALTASLKKQYKAEAVFVRCLCYFFMVRLWGDVPYYTNAYNTKALPRTPMVQVLKNCVADLSAVTDDLPWTYADPSQRAVRAMRGSAYVLLMHINMWLAGFDDGGKAQYYKSVDSLGDQLINKNGGAYQLLPLEQTKTIFKGRSQEGLFEIPQNLNYGESFGYSAFSDNVLHYPYKTIDVKQSYFAYLTTFMQKLYPSGVVDKRVNIWFQTSNMYSQNGTFLLLKFVNVFAHEGEDFNPDDNQIVFRLPDAILLRAEAQAQLGNLSGGAATANLVRARAGATPFPTSGWDQDKLIDNIFDERCRELMGEGHYFYDMVRSMRIMDPSKVMVTIPVSAFKAGAWTWPLDPSVQANNPFVTLNTYWQ